MKKCFNNLDKECTFECRMFEIDLNTNEGECLTYRNIKNMIEHYNTGLKLAIELNTETLELVKRQKGNYE